MGFAQYDIKKFNTERKTYFEGLGVGPEKNTNYLTALKVADMDWSVTKRPLSDTMTGTETTASSICREDLPLDAHGSIRNPFATDTTGKYAIVNNSDLAPIIQPIIDRGFEIETLGNFKDGARSFITLNGGKEKILGEDYSNYLLITNSFDKSGSVMFANTPVRVFCSNCLTRALKNATAKVSVRHSGIMEWKLKEISEILLQNINYLEELRKQSEIDATTQFTKEQFNKWAETFVRADCLPKSFREGDEISDLAKARMEAKLESLRQAYNQADLRNFNNTAYKAIQAVADYESHKPLLRNTSGIAEANINTVIMGMPMLNQMIEYINATV